MHGLAVVPESELREPLRIAGDLRAFGPRVTVGMQADADDAESTAALPEFVRAVARLPPAQISFGDDFRRAVIRRGPVAKPSDNDLPFEKRDLAVFFAEG